MGLTYYDDRNKIESSLLQTWFSSEPVSAPGLSDGWRVYKRIRTKSYQFVGMTKATARQCVVDKQNLYKRLYGRWKLSQPYGYWQWVYDTEDTYYDFVANISASHQDGDMWNVEIQVNETCYLYYNSPVELLDPELVFEQYYGPSVWKYDEDGEQQ